MAVNAKREIQVLAVRPQKVSAAVASKRSVNTRNVVVNAHLSRGLFN
nr:hypothetical protein [Candidatus Mycoplasma haematolamae]